MRYVIPSTLARSMLYDLAGAGFFESIKQTFFRITNSKGRKDHGSSEKSAKRHDRQHQRETSDELFHIGLLVAQVGIVGHTTGQRH